MGVQFHRTASQNTMAAAIQEDTNHSWEKCPLMLSTASLQWRRTQMEFPPWFTKNIALRWLAIYVISTSALMVLGIFESNLCRACKRHIFMPRTPKANGGNYDSVQLLFTLSQALTGMQRFRGLFRGWAGLCSLVSEARMRLCCVTLVLCASLQEFPQLRVIIACVATRCRAS